MAAHYLNLSLSGQSWESIASEYRGPESTEKQVREIVLHWLKTHGTAIDLFKKLDRLDASLDKMFLEAVCKRRRALKKDIDAIADIWESRADIIGRLRKIESGGS